MSASSTSRRPSGTLTGPTRNSGVARKGRPANAVNPADPAYDWSVYDAMVKRSKDNGIKVVFSILWTPGWAGPAKNRAPRRMIDLRNFAYAAAKRYSGSFRPAPDAVPLPAVHYWMAWNEPNNPVFLKPQFVPAGHRHFKLSSPRIYAQMCNSIWSSYCRNTSQHNCAVAGFISGYPVS